MWWAMRDCVWRKLTEQQMNLLEIVPKIYCYYGQVVQINLDVKEN